MSHLVCSIAPAARYGTKHTQPGTHLHDAWAHLDAPPIAKNYWQLRDDAKWVDALKHMLADEAHHRDVNHTFASLPPGSDNPFVHEHMQDFDRAALRRSERLLKSALQRELRRVEGVGRDEGSSGSSTPEATTGSGGEQKQQQFSR